jgi:hypothetical protein
MKYGVNFWRGTKQGLNIMHQSNSDRWRREIVKLKTKELLRNLIREKEPPVIYELAVGAYSRPSLVSTINKKKLLALLSVVFLFLLHVIQNMSSASDFTNSLRTAIRYNSLAHLYTGVCVRD